MSHKQNIFSAPGTPLMERTVGELVAERPGRSRIFQRYGIDFCCQGGRRLREACEARRVAIASLVEQLEAELQEQAEATINPAELPPHELTDYIVRTHHDFLRAELPRLMAMAERVARVHGGHTPSLVELFETFHHLSDELASHISKEEQVLFPFVAALSRGEAVSGSIEGPVACMIAEHEEAGNALKRIRELTNSFSPPSDACNTYRALFAGLEELEGDMHRHIHLENSVLFPRAQGLISQES